MKPREFLPVTGIVLFHMMYPDGTTMGAIETSFIFHTQVGESLFIRITVKNFMMAFKAVPGIYRALI